MPSVPCRARRRPAWSARLFSMPARTRCSIDSELAAGSAACRRAHSLASINGRWRVNGRARSRAVQRRCETDKEARFQAELAGRADSAPSSAMNPPPMEKNVRSHRTAPATSNAVNRRPLGCWVRAPGRKHLIAMEEQVARFVERDWPIAREARCCLEARIAATVDSMAAGSMEAGSLPPGRGGRRDRFHGPCR